MSLHSELLQLARDEGQQTAFDVIDRLVDSLEDIAEIGDSAERGHAVALLASVQRISAMLDSMRKIELLSARLLSS